MISPRSSSRAVAALLVAVALAACAGDERFRGGASSLPGPVPDGVSYAPADTSMPTAPEVSLTLVDGTPVNGAELWRDRPVVLFFFASWCAHCVEQQVELNAVLERWGDSIAVLGIAGEDEAADVATFLQERGVSHAVAIDDGLTTWRSYGVREPPHVVVIAREGRVARGWPGVTTRDTLTDSLEDLIQTGQDP